MAVHFDSLSMVILPWFYPRKTRPFQHWDTHPLSFLHLQGTGKGSLAKQPGHILQQIIYGFSKNARESISSPHFSKHSPEFVAIYQI